MRLGAVTAQHPHTRRCGGAPTEGSPLAAAEEGLHGGHQRSDGMALGKVRVRGRSAAGVGQGEGGDSGAAAGGEVREALQLGLGEEEFINWGLEKKGLGRGALTGNGGGGGFTMRFWRGGALQLTATVSQRSARERQPAALLWTIGGAWEQQGGEGGGLVGQLQYRSTEDKGDGAAHPSLGEKGKKG
jgi:hypothetical protein